MKSHHVYDAIYGLLESSITVFNLFKMLETGKEGLAALSPNTAPEL